MQTASISGSSKIAPGSSTTRAMPNSSATRWPLSRERLQTAASSTPSIAWKPGMWRVRVFAPAPMKPDAQCVPVAVSGHARPPRALLPCHAAGGQGGGGQRILCVPAAARQTEGYAAQLSGWSGMTQQRDGGQPQAEVSALLRAVGQLLVAISGDEPAASAPPARPEAPPRTPSPMEEIEQFLGDARARAQQLIDESLADARARLERLAGEGAPPAEQPPAEQPSSGTGALDEKLRSLQELLGDIEALQRSGEPEPPSEEPPAATSEAEELEEPEEPAAAVEGSGEAERVEAVAWSEDESPSSVRFHPDDGSVLLRVAPVEGFQGLLRVQGMLAQLPGVRQAFVEGYAEGEAQLRLTFDSALEVAWLGAALGERLGVTVQAADVSEAERSLRLELR